ncbi:T-cell immunoglobulin and mucin domain-containing protein 4-like [Trachemys scripta elegans]|uniref:T-cell immunoglobulin and mucin domain-containing protein 4-like n=1 Tax=Trachemys scripta elegans TaxID=31138 RepID=UPI00155745FF|nr:T-cell immunoglobulin and mucin domain-containing protein 4-like [Trachemys scripta elegans]
MAHSLLLRWIVLQLCIAHGVSDTTVRVKVGQSVRLPCTYSVRETHDLHVMCWGRGICPSSKCSSEIVRTDGQKVISKQSGRYQLQGSITKGDVSLTIRNVDHEDRGTYCCRIEIPGWFNDIKRNLNLQIYRARTPPAKTTTTAVPTSTTPPLITSSALPTPTAPPTTTTTALPTTFPSPTTIFQTASACTEDDDFIFFTTEHVLPTAESPTTELISERTENVDPAFTTEGVLSTVTAVATVQTSTVRPDHVHTSTDNPFATGTVPPVMVQTVSEASEVNAISDATFPLTPAGDSVKEELSEETSKDSKLQSEESVDNPAQHLQNEIPTVIISVVVTVILLFTFLLVVLLTYKRWRKYQLHMIKSSDLSGEQIPNGVEEENTLLTMQQIPDGHSVSQGTCHDPVESSI